jgi:hypothetical protein
MSLVKEAVDLFVETMPMETMSPDHPMFWELYEKECQILELLNRMTDEEHASYRAYVQLKMFLAEIK